MFGHKNTMYKLSDGTYEIHLRAISWWSANKMYKSPAPPRDLSPMEKINFIREHSAPAYAAFSPLGKDLLIWCYDKEKDIIIIPLAMVEYANKHGDGDLRYWDVEQKIVGDYIYNYMYRDDEKAAAAFERYMDHLADTRKSVENQDARYYSGELNNNSNDPWEDGFGDLADIARNNCD